MSLTQQSAHAGTHKLRLLLGTTNRGKIRELIALLAARWPLPGNTAWQIEAIAPGNAASGNAVAGGAKAHFELPEVEETGATMAENAAIKATAYAQACGQWTLADDTALAVDALNGAPGIHTARYAGPHASATDNRRRLLAELDGVSLDRRGAHFTCHLALADPTGTIRATSEGRCHGQICTQPAGDEGFGYDPLFEIIEFRRTFAELGLASRSVLSHRARAMEKMLPQIADLLALDPPNAAEG